MIMSQFLSYSVRGNIMNFKNTAAIILAAGKGTRMQSDKPKVLHEVGGLSMIGHVLTAADQIDKTIAVVGYGRDEVVAELHRLNPDATAVEQTEQLGTGHAVQQAEEALKGFTGDVVVLNGDVPLVTPELLEQMFSDHHSQNNTVTVLTTTVPDPTGLGRIIRDTDGNFQSIIEHKDATEIQRQVDEINTGIYLVKAPDVFDLLRQVTNKNASGEFYLTDIVELARNKGQKVGTCFTDDGPALLGVNTPQQLADAERIFQERQRLKKLSDGVFLKDPSSVFFSHDTVIGKGTSIGPNVQCLKGVNIGENNVIEGNTVLKDTTSEAGVTVLSFCHLEGAVISSGCSVGPFARLRPGTGLGQNSKVGNFCEMKNTTLGAGSKASHLSYLGDAEIGMEVNIGAGTITCNYDGRNKHKTTIENKAFIGSNTSLVAPVRIGEGALIGAGATIRKDVGRNELAFTSAQQKQTSKKKA
mgnify:CR=1 FL=1